MKIASYSDPHGCLDVKIPNSVDLLLVGGDISDCRGSHNPVNQLYWIKNHFIPYIKDQAKDIVFIPGNHDFCFEMLMNQYREDEFRNDLPKNVHYLRDSMIEIDGLKIYGTPWTPPFYDWAFMAEETELDRKFSGIPEGIDILLSHGPAYGLADAITERFDIGKNCGSHSLLKHVQRVMPTYFFSGHIHSADHRVNEYVYNNKVTKYANVSILDEYYEPAYFPLVYPPPQI